MTSYPTTPALRIDLNPDDIGRGLAQLVLTVLELLRELLERQAIRRMDCGDLDAEQTERLGRALLDVHSGLTELSQALAQNEADPLERLINKTASLGRFDRSGKDIS